MIKLLNFKNKNGITLIALVITIIVMLILAAISITMLTGDNSILKRAGEAKEKTEIAETKEQVQIQVLGSFEERANLNLKTLKTNLESIGAKVIADNFPVTAILNHKSYKIDASGNVEMQENADRTGINVGDYINFEPDTDQDAEGNPVAKKYSKDYLKSEYTGNTYNNSDIEQKSLKWQVLKIYEDGSMKLIGDNSAGGFDLGGASNSYNNGVWLLNDICEQLYSKKRAGIIARSVNLEDFEDDDYYKNEIEGIWKRSKENYIKEQVLARKTELDNESDYIQAVDTENNTVTYKKKYSYYPDLYAKENGLGIDTTTIKTDGIERSDKYVTSRDLLDTSRGTSYKQANNYLTTKNTACEIQINDLNFGDVYKVLSGNYLIASRVVLCSSNYAEYGFPVVNNDVIGFRRVMISKNGYRSQSAGFRPVVTLGPNVRITPSKTASSEDGIPHEITSYK